MAKVGNLFAICQKVNLKVCIFHEKIFSSQNISLEYSIFFEEWK